MIRFTDAQLAHVRADLERQGRTGRVPLSPRELEGLLARLDAAEEVCRALTGEPLRTPVDPSVPGNEILRALDAWEATIQPKHPLKEQA